jgi:hypothetical protein
MPPGTSPIQSGPPYQRLFQDTGFRYTWLNRDGSDDLGINELDLSTSMYLANFFHSANGLFVSPGFTFDWLDGPDEPSLPARLYAAYLDFGWEPQFTPRLGGELNFRTGVYSDFESVTSQSIRFIGTGVGVIKATPTMSLKLGIAYIDRARIKLLPAFGVLWEPNPQTRWDIFFPTPKLAHYWTTLGNSQLWWYVGGEYGGGSWTIEREPGTTDAGASDRVDINDIRVYLGLEKWNHNRCYSFCEFGFVFDREIVYVLVPDESTSLGNTVMLRAGLSF